MAFEIPSFITGGNTGNTPESVKRKRKIQEALMASLSTTPTNPWEGLNSITKALAANKQGADATAAETEGAASSKAILDALMANPDATAQDYAAALSDPWLQQNPGATAYAQAGLGQEMQQQDPMNQIDLKLKEAELAAMQNPQPDLPASADEYNWYAEQEKAAGRDPLTFLDFEAAKKGGMSLSMGPDGTMTMTQGNGKPLTEAGSKDVFYYIRGSGANDALTENEASLTSLQDTGLGSIPLVGNYFTSEGFKNANRDAKEFLAAVLRKDSGGAITEEEWATYGPMYIPIPGDGPDQIARKKKARDRTMAALEATFSQAGQTAVDTYNAGQTVETPAGPAAPAAGGVQPGPDGIYDASDYLLNGQGGDV